MKKIMHSLALAALTALVASPAFAQWNRQEPGHRASQPEEDGTGFTLGLRGAFGMPMGTLGGTQDVSSVTSGQIPLWAEVGYRLNRNVTLGVFAQLTKGFAAGCPNQASCSTSDTRFGVEATYAFMPGSMLSPWAGLGVGYEILSWSRAGADSSASGLEYGNAQVGVDLSLNAHSSVGPFAAMTVGKFSSQNSGGVSTSYTDSGLHGWTQFGLRFAYKL